jgi:hypothetical protein
MLTDQLEKLQLQLHTLAFLCCLIFCCAAILYVLTLRGFCTGFVFVVVVVVDHDKKMPYDTDFSTCRGRISAPIESNAAFHPSSHHERKNHSIWSIFDRGMAL